MRPPPCAAVAGAAGLWLVLAPPATAPAWALCPNCLAQQSTLTPTLKLIGLFLLIPFALAAAVFWLVRRLSERQRSGASPLGYRRASASPPPSAPPSPAPASSAGGVQSG